MYGFSLDVLERIVEGIEISRGGAIVAIHLWTVEVYYVEFKSWCVVLSGQIGRQLFSAVVVDVLLSRGLP